MTDLDLIYRALADRRRRHVLLCLKRHHTVSLPDLAELVAEKEDGGRIVDIDDETVAETYFSLYHAHIPLLEEADLVDYQQGEDRVVRAERTTAVLAHARDELNVLLRV